MTLVDLLFVPYVFTLAPCAMFYWNLIRERRLWERSWFVPLLYATLASKPSLSYYYSGEQAHGNGFSIMDVVTAVIPGILVLIHLIAERVVTSPRIFAWWETFFLASSHYALAYVLFDATLPTFYAGTLEHHRLPEEYLVSSTNPVLHWYAASHFVCAFLQSMNPNIFGAALLRVNSNKKD